MTDKLQIEDLVEQDHQRVVFQAREIETGRRVALIRFLPFGSHVGGLPASDQLVFKTRIEVLRELECAGLRRVIGGGCDPVDALPYVAIEWLDGRSLKEVRGASKLSVEDTRNILIRALEVSELVARVLQLDDVWVDTDPRTIVLSESEDGQAVVFSVSVLKCAGVDVGFSGLEALADLAEQLQGWQGRLVGDQAGEGLGGWIRWVRANPRASVRMARERLLARSIEDAAGSKFSLRRAAKTPHRAARAPHAGASAWIGAGVAVLLMLAAGWWGFQWIGANRSVMAASSGDAILGAGEPLVERSHRESNRVVVDPLAGLLPQVERAAVPAVPLRADEPEPPSEVRTEIPAVAGDGPDIRPPAGVFDSRQLEEIMPHFRDQVTVEGVLAQVRLAANRRIWYLEFSKTMPHDHVRAFLYVTDGPREITRSDLEPLLGKRVRIRGRVDTEMINKVRQPKLIMDGMAGITKVDP